MSGILFLTHQMITPSTRYRILQYIPYFQKESVVCECLRMPQGIFDRLSILGKLKDFDCVFLQKRPLSRLWFDMIRKRSKRLIYEYDDAVYLKKTGLRSSTRSQRFKYMVQNVDLVITSNDYLAQEALRHTGKVEIIPNCLDLNRWHCKEGPVSDKPQTIGWIGSSANLKYLAQIKQALSCIFELFKDVRLKVVCDKPFEFERVENVLFSGENEQKDVRSFDIAIAPYPDDDWTKGKLPVKILSYMATGLPVVASDVTCTRRLIQDQLNGLLCRDTNDWIQKLSFLLESPELRDKLGSSARKTVEDKFSLEKIYRRYLELLIGL